METFKYTTSSRTILADLYTPVGVYMRLRDIYPQSALMESSDYHDANNSRSFIGINPIASVAIGHGEATVTFPDGSIKRNEVNKAYRSDKAIHALIDHISVTGEHADSCGLYGYTSFNAVRYFEDIAVKDETQEKNDAPDMLYILYKDIIIFDHFNNQLTIVTLGGETELDNIFRQMNKSNIQAYDFHPVGDVASTLTDEEHKENIRKGIKHCLRGDVFQIVLSRRFIQKYEGDDFKLYRALRSRKCRCGGQRAGEDTGCVSRADAGDQRKAYGNGSTHHDDQRAHRHIRLGIDLQVPEELRTGDAADRGNKQHQTDVGNELKAGDLGVAGVCHIELIQNRDVRKTRQGAKITEQQGKQEHASGAQIQPLYLHRTNGVADKADQKHAEQHSGSSTQTDQLRNKIHENYISLRRL